MRMSAEKKKIDIDVFLQKKANENYNLDFQLRKMYLRILLLGA